MKTYAIPLLSGVIFLLVTSFNYENFKQLKKDGYVFVQGEDFEMFDDVSVKKGFYISKGEITNKQYREFLSELKSSGQSELYEIAAVDSMAWFTIGGYQEPYMVYYHKHPAYDNYPVVNVSFEAAQLFCTWLTEKYKSEGLNVTVSLPTENQWIFAACAGDAANKYGWRGNEINDTKGNYKGGMGGLVGDGLYMSPSVSFKPNAFGIYNMSGNVAEMLNEQGHFKGGHFWSDEQGVLVSATSEFEKEQGPSPYIGFRPVIIIN